MGTSNGTNSWGLRLHIKTAGWPASEVWKVVKWRKQHEQYSDDTEQSEAWEQRDGYPRVDQGEIDQSPDELDIMSRYDSVTSVGKDDNAG
jgi:hypothetical protein